VAEPSQYKVTLYGVPSLCHEINDASEEFSYLRDFLIAQPGVGDPTSP
jgi:hypothetical protein